MRRCRRVDVGKEKVDGVEATGICDPASGDAVSCGGQARSTTAPLARDR
jgi:uncharacterized membrane protein